MHQISSGWFALRPLGDALSLGLIDLRSVSPLYCILPMHTVNYSIDTRHVPTDRHKTSVVRVSLIGAFRFGDRTARIYIDIRHEITRSARSNVYTKASKCYWHGNLCDRKNNEQTMRLPWSRLVAPLIDSAWNASHHARRTVAVTTACLTILSIGFITQSHNRAYTVIIT